MNEHNLGITRILSQEFDRKDVKSMTESSQGSHQLMIS